MLTEEQQQALVDLARRSVVAQVAGERIEMRTNGPEFPQASGVFVTLTSAGDLRGCLGTLQCSRGLAAEVTRCAADAASTDPRFPPVQTHELRGISLEVSVLGPLEAIDPFDEGAVIVGRHGLVAEQGRARGLLLPQVASERHWTPEYFLAQTCVKAGLPPDAWRNGATIYRFEAQVFGAPLTTEGAGA